jgi:hypothetical protein
MKTRRFALPILSVLFSVSCLLTAGVHAADVPARGPMALSDYDTDKNGVISEAEFNAAHASRMQEKANTGMPMKGAANRPMFSQFDSNNDGQLSADELKNGQMKHQQEMMDMRKQQMPGMHQQNMPKMNQKNMNQ